MRTNLINSYKKNTFVNYKLLVMPFQLGFLSALKINFFGEIYLGEIIFMVFLLSKFPRLNFPKQELSLFFFAMLWASAQFVSDVNNGTQVNYALKGIFTPIFFIFTFLGFFSYFKKRFNRFPSFILGASFGALAQLLIFGGNAYFEDNMWKWGLGGELLSIVVIYLSFFVRGPKKLLIFLVVFSFGVVSVINSARSLAFLPIISSILFLIFHGNKQYSVIRWLKRGVTGLKLLIIVILSIIVMNGATTALFSSDRFLENFSEDVALKYKTQAAGKYGMLLGGRPELLASVKAFLDKPFLGHGSWAMDKEFYYTDMINELKLELGYENIRADYSKIKLVPAHSFLTGSVVWAGIFGGLFWLVLINKVLKIFILNINVLPIYFYTGVIFFVWDFLFSPFMAITRWHTALFLATFFLYSYLLNTNQGVKKYK